MNCLTGDRIKGFLRAYGTKYLLMPFLHQRCLLMVFFCTCTKSSMLTLTNCSRVPISTGTLGTVMCWDFSLIPSGPLCRVFPMQEFKKGSLLFLLRHLGWWRQKALKKVIWCPVVGLVEWDFSSCFHSYFLELLNSNFARILDREF